MEGFSLKINGEEGLVITIDWRIVVALLASIFIFIIVIKFLTPGKINKTINKFEVDEASLGIGKQTLLLKYDTADEEIAYKIWVEMKTRKIGLMFEDDRDVIKEVYDSWYEFFKNVRQLIKEIPVRKARKNPDLIDITTNILNAQLRNHLTTYQAKFRRWWEFEIVDSKNTKLSPQDIQKKYEDYEALVADLKETNSKMIIYMNILYRIAFEKEA